MHFPFAKQVVIGIGAAAVILIVATLAFFSIRNNLANPASQVPARETVAFFTNITKGNAGAFAASVPMLSQVALDDTPSAVAIIKTGSGQNGWAVLQRTPAGKEPFSLRVSDPSLSSLFQDIRDPLSATRAYRTLSKNTTDPSAWLRFPDVSIHPASPLVPLLNTTEPVSVVLQADGLEIRVLSDSAFPVLMSGPKEVFGHPLFIVHVSNGTALLKSAPSYLQDEPLLVAKTVLSNALVSLFGKDFSPTYDLPPLLAGTTTIELAKSEGLQLRLYMEGTADDSSAITHLGDLFKTTLTSATRYTQTFDDKFEWQDIREDSSVIEDIRNAENSWTTRRIKQTQTGKSLFIATRGKKYILSNDADAFQKAITIEATPLGTSETPPAGLGLIQSAELTDLLRRTMPTVWPSTRTIPAGHSGFLKWKLTQEGRRTTLFLKKI